MKDVFEIPDSDLERVTAGMEKMAIALPLLVPILFPPRKVAEARAALAQKRSGKE